jgi:folate-binding protein YgfZ
MSVDRIRDYQAIREGAAIGSIARRSPIGVAGRDRASYLQGLLTNDIEALSAGSGCYAAWLSPQGRMLTDMHVLQGDGLLLLDVPADLAETVFQRLDQFLFSEDVQLQSLHGALEALWLHGPLAAATLGRVLGATSPFDQWPAYHHERIAFDGDPVVVARIDQLGVPGFCIYVEPSRRGSLTASLERAGAISVHPDAIEAARIENGYPVFGVDMTDETIPLEAGIEDRAISFTKGCYVGQEIIIRVLHRGGGRVARRLVALRIDGAVPPPGARLFSGEREVGVVTSAVESPRAGVIALAYAHRDFTAAGTGLAVDTAAGRAAAVVSERPLPSTV